jgi:hypothetical protein
MIVVLVSGLQGQIKELLRFVLDSRSICSFLKTSYGRAVIENVHSHQWSPK